MTRQMTLVGFMQAGNVTVYSGPTLRDHLGIPRPEVTEPGATA